MMEESYFHINKCCDEQSNPLYMNLISCYCLSLSSLSFKNVSKINAFPSGRRIDFQSMLIFDIFLMIHILKEIYVARYKISVTSHSFIRYKYNISYFFRDLKWVSDDKTNPFIIVQINCTSCRNCWTNSSAIIQTGLC